MSAGLGRHTRRFDRTRWWVETTLLIGLFLALFVVVLAGMAVLT